MNNKLKELVIGYATTYFFQNLDYTYFTGLAYADDSRFEHPAKLKMAIRRN